MKPEEYAKMYDLEDTYWWFQGRRSIVEGALESIAPFRRPDARVLDLGCGTGLMLERLNRQRWSVGLDFSPLALKFSGKRGAKRLLRADAERVPLLDETIDVAIALDLAEHVERDDRLFAEAYRVLKPRGRLLLTVPAHPFLWSDHDEALYHHRRYRRAELDEKLRRAGFHIDRLTYCITFTFPFIMSFRLLQRFFQRPGHPKTHLIVLPRWANRLLCLSVEIEGFLLKRFNLPFGVTLLAVAAKQDA